jgi:hypothetical protein
LIAELGFDYKTLCIGNREKACGFLVIFWKPFDNFNVLSVIIY